MSLPIEILDGLKERLVEWRRVHPAPKAYPLELWTEVTALAAEFGISPVARQLGLDYASVKRHLLAGEGSQSATFFEVLAPPVLISRCILHLDNQRGCKAEVHFEEIPPAALASSLCDWMG